MKKNKKTWIAVIPLFLIVVFVLAGFGVWKKYRDTLMENQEKQLLLTTRILSENMSVAAREYEDNLEYFDVTLLNAIKKAAIEYCKSQTGLAEIEIDKHEDITVAVLALISDMWDNRSMSVQKSNVNRVVDSILGMHRTNLVPTPDTEVI